jgi:hypothetical protein
MRSAGTESPGRSVALGTIGGLMSDAANSAARRHFIVLTCRPADSDFRYHLARELHALGHRVTYIFMKRSPLVTDFDTGTTEGWSIGRLLRYFRDLRKLSEKPVIFNSTNLAFPWASILLRAISGTFWCFDMHDNLLYESTGWRRRRYIVEQACVVGQSDLVVHAAPTLQKLFPQSVHLGNGSSLQPEPKVGEDSSRVLIIASLDGRCNLDMMEAAAKACPDRRFEIYGRIWADAQFQKRFDALIAGAPNLSYHGAYNDLQLPGLLANYLVCFAPYKVDDPLTDYIDPLRFYHCLASRTGLVSTAIPQALAMRDRIEVIEDVAGLDAALDRAIAHRDRPGTSWRDVAEKLVAIINSRLKG